MLFHQLGKPDKLIRILYYFFIGYKSAFTLFTHQISLLEQQFKGFPYCSAAYIINFNEFVVAWEEIIFLIFALSDAAQQFLINFIIFRKWLIQLENLCLSFTGIYTTCDKLAIKHLWGSFGENIHQSITQKNHFMKI